MANTTIQRINKKVDSFILIDFYSYEYIFIVKNNSFFYNKKVSINKELTIYKEVIILMIIPIHKHVIPI